MGNKRASHRQEMRERILQAGRDSLRANGLGNTTISEIIRRSGCSSGTVYGYFRDKEEIVEEIAREVLLSHRDEICEIAHRAVVPAPADMLRELLASFEHDPARTGLILQFWGMGGAPRVEVISRQMLVQMRAAFGQYLEQWLACQTRQGQPTTVQPGQEIALASIFQGYVVQRSLDPELTVETYMDAVNALVRPHVSAHKNGQPVGSSAT